MTQLLNGLSHQVETPLASSGLEHPHRGGDGDPLPVGLGAPLDGVRPLGRLIRRARPAVAPRLAGVWDAFQTGTRSARRQVPQIHQATWRKGAAAVAAPQEG
jgi:hypothetical protein